MSVKELEKYIKETLEPRITELEGQNKELEGENKLLSEKVETLEEGQKGLEDAIDDQGDEPTIDAEQLSGSVARNADRITAIEQRVGAATSQPTKVERGIPKETFEVNGETYRFLAAAAVIPVPGTGRNKRFVFREILNKPADLAFVVENAPKFVQKVG